MRCSGFCRWSTRWRRQCDGVWGSVGMATGTSAQRQHFHNACLGAHRGQLHAVRRERSVSLRRRSTRCCWFPRRSIRPRRQLCNFTATAAGFCTGTFQFLTMGSISTWKTLASGSAGSIATELAGRGQHDRAGLLGRCERWPARTISARFVHGYSLTRYVGVGD